MLDHTIIHLTLSHKAIRSDCTIWEYGSPVRVLVQASVLGIEGYMLSPEQEEILERRRRHWGERHTLPYVHTLCKPHAEHI